MDTAIDDLWREFCRLPDLARKYHHFDWPDFDWYDENSETAFEDFQLCQQDTERGVEEAQKRMLEFLAWRMKS